MGNDYDLLIREMQDKLMPPPRPVPLNIQIGNFFGDTKSRIGWHLLPVGLLVLGINLSIKEISFFSVVLLGGLIISGIVLIFLGFKKGRLHNYLLANGVLTAGKLVDKQSTATRINNRRVFKLIYEYTADDGKQYQTTVRTHRTERLSSGTPEAVIHFPGYGEVATLVKAMPTSPELGEDGAFRSAGPGNFLKTIFMLIVPAITLVFGSAYLLDWLGIIPLPSFLDIQQILYQLIGGSESAY